jgi:hypothetical protein
MLAHCTRAGNADERADALEAGPVRTFESESKGLVGRVDVVEERHCYGSADYGS